MQNPECCIFDSNREAHDTETKHTSDKSDEEDENYDTESRSTELITEAVKIRWAFCSGSIGTKMGFVLGITTLILNYAIFLRAYVNQKHPYN